VALADLGQLDEAISQYWEALRVKPDYAEAHINLGIELARQGSIRDAVDHFSEAIRIKPNSAEGHYNLGKAHLYLHNRSAALQEYEILKTLDPRLANDLRRMAGR
jgi:tetratricopeptide (TPR) repeat protein